MGTFKRFEDIIAWQKARELNLEIYGICGSGPFSKDFDLRNQVRRSSVSIAANIAEGQGRRSDKDFAHFLTIALGSVAETKPHLYLALDVGYLDKTAFDELYTRLDEIGRMTFGLIQHLRSANKTIEV